MGRKAVRKKRNTNPKRREKYILQLLPVFYEFGLQALSMDDICSKLNVSKATLYNYFATKEDMVTAILQHVLGEIAGFEKIIGSKEMSFLDRYFTSVQLLTKSVAGISNLFLNDLQTNFPDLWQIVRDFRDYAASVLKDFYEEGKRDNILTGYSTDILVLSDRLFFDACTEPKILAANNLTIEKAFQEYFKLKCFGMLDISSNTAVKAEALALINKLEL